MRNFAWHAMIAAAAVGVSLLVSGTASAQGYGRASAANRLQRPTVSPYLNLYRQGGGFNNYYTLVRPALQQERINGVQQTEIGQLRSQLATEQQEITQRGLPQTGHRSEFRYYSHFYSKKR
jgi:hypothetical protein